MICLSTTTILIRGITLKVVLKGYIKAKKFEKKLQSFLFLACNGLQMKPHLSLKIFFEDPTAKLSKHPRKKVYFPITRECNKLLVLFLPFLIEWTSSITLE